MTITGTGAYETMRAHHRVLGEELASGLGLSHQRVHQIVEPAGDPLAEVRWPGPGVWRVRIGRAGA